MEYSALRTGLAILPLTVGVMVAAGASSRLSGVPVRFVMSFGLVLGACGLLLLSRLAPDSSYVPAIMPSLIMIGLGMGLVVPHALNLATFGVAANDTGIASAMSNVSQQAGASLTIAVMNTAAAVATVNYLASNSNESAAGLQGQIEGYNAAALYGAGILLIAAVVALASITARTVTAQDNGRATATATTTDPPG